MSKYIIRPDGDISAYWQNYVYLLWVICWFQRNCLFIMGDLLVLAILEDADESSQNMCVSNDIQMYQDKGKRKPDHTTHGPRGNNKVITQ